MYEMLIEPLAPWKFWIDMTAAACAFGAAVFWLLASLVKTPAAIRDFVDQPIGGPLRGDMGDLVSGIKKQSRLNAWAAGFAAVAAAVTALSVVIGTRWEP